jgi:hypothetical protein
MIHDEWHYIARAALGSIFHLTYFSFLADPTSKVLHIWPILTIIKMVFFGWPRYSLADLFIKPLHYWFFGWLPANYQLASHVNQNTFQWANWQHFTKFSNGAVGRTCTTVPHGQDPSYEDAFWIPHTSAAFISKGACQPLALSAASLHQGLQHHTPRIVDKMNTPHCTTTSLPSPFWPCTPTPLSSKK